MNQSKIYLETTHTVCQIVLLLVMLARTNLTLWKHCFKNKQINFGKQTVDTQINNENLNIKFYTGINTIAHFNRISRLIQLFLSNVIYWTRPKHAKNFSKIRHRICNTPKKLSQRDEFLLELMRLSLGYLIKILQKDLEFNQTFVHIYL